MDCGALAFVFFFVFSDAQEGLGCSNPRFHLQFGMFQIFVRRTLFCALSPVPLSGGAAHAGFQLKIFTVHAAMRDFTAFLHILADN